MSRAKFCLVPFFALASGASIPLESTDHDPLRLKSGAESAAIKDPGGWNGSLGSAPSITGLGRITHPSPSLNTASAQNSKSRRGCQEAPGRDLARPAQSGGPSGPMNTHAWCTKEHLH